MTDYALTAGQQQLLSNFLNDGKSIYLEGNDFGYYHGNTALYKMFGCNYLGDHAVISTLDGQTETISNPAATSYLSTGYTDDYLDYIGDANGGTLCFLSQDRKGRVVSYCGPNGSYRAIHCAYWFGAQKNTGASHTKAQIMAGYMNFLKGDTLLTDLGPEISAKDGGQVQLMLEQPASEANRAYAIVGTTSGTTPGFVYGPVTIPINYDIFTALVINKWNSVLFTNFVNYLDGNGHACAFINFGKGPGSGHVGTTMNFAYVLADPIDVASNPVEVPIVP